MPRHSQLWEQKGRSLPSIQGLGQERLESKERLKSAQPSRKATREPQRNSRMVGLLSPKTAPPIPAPSSLAKLTSTTLMLLNMRGSAREPSALESTL